MAKFRHYSALLLAPIVVLLVVKWQFTVDKLCFYLYLRWFYGCKTLL